MTNTSRDDSNLPLDNLSAYALVRRADLWSRLLRREEEESIARLVPVDLQWLSNEKQGFIGERSLVDVLLERHWDEPILTCIFIFLRRSNGLHWHVSSRFEEKFLFTKDVMTRLCIPRQNS